MWSAIQILLLCTCFNFETPVELKTSKHEEKLLLLAKRTFSEQEAKKRLEQIILPVDNELGESEENVGYYAAFVDPKYRGASWVAFWMGMLQQWTGMNAIVFYSAQLFAGSSDHPES